MSKGVMQVWHTPVRQLQRVLMSQASASSRTLRQLVAKRAEMPLRATLQALVRGEEPPDVLRSTRWSGSATGR